MTTRTTINDTPTPAGVKITVGNNESHMVQKWLRPLVRVKSDVRLSKQPEEGWTKYMQILIQINMEMAQRENKIKDKHILNIIEEYDKTKK